MLRIVTVERDTGDMAVFHFVAEVAHIAVQFPGPLRRVANPQPPSRGTLGPIDHDGHDDAVQTPAVLLSRTKPGHMECIAIAPVFHLIVISASVIRDCNACV